MRPSAAGAIIGRMATAAHRRSSCFPDVQALDVTGPSEVFSLAHRASGEGAYELELVAG